MQDAEVPWSWLFIANEFGLPLMSVRHGIKSPIPLAQQGLVHALFSSAEHAGMSITRMTGRGGRDSALLPPGQSELAYAASLDHTAPPVMLAMFRPSVSKFAAPINRTARRPIAPSSLDPIATSVLAVQRPAAAVQLVAECETTDSDTKSRSDASYNRGEVLVPLTLRLLQHVVHTFLGTRDWSALLANPNNRQLRTKLGSLSPTVQAILRFASCAGWVVPSWKLCLLPNQSAPASASIFSRSPVAASANFAVGSRLFVTHAQSSALRYLLTNVGASIGATHACLAFGTCVAAASDSWWQLRASDQAVLLLRAAHEGPAAASQRSTPSTAGTNVATDSITSVSFGFLLHLPAAPLYAGVTAAAGASKESTQHLCIAASALSIPVRVIINQPTAAKADDDKAPEYVVEVGGADDSGLRLIFIRARPNVLQSSGLDAGPPGCTIPGEFSAECASSATRILLGQLASVRLHAFPGGSSAGAAYCGDWANSPANIIETHPPGTSVLAARVPEKSGSTQSSRPSRQQQQQLSDVPSQVTSHSFGTTLGGSSSDTSGDHVVRRESLPLPLPAGMRLVDAGVIVRPSWMNDATLLRAEPVIAVDAGNSTCDSVATARGLGQSARHISGVSGVSLPELPAVNQRTSSSLALTTLPPTALSYVVAALACVVSSGRCLISHAPHACHDVDTVGDKVSNLAHLGLGQLSAGSSATTLKLTLPSNLSGRQLSVYGTPGRATSQSIAKSASSEWRLQLVGFIAVPVVTHRLEASGAGIEFRASDAVAFGATEDSKSPTALFSILSSSVVEDSVYSLTREYPCAAFRSVSEKNTIARADAATVIVTVGLPLSKFGAAGDRVGSSLAIGFSMAVSVLVHIQGPDVRKNLKALEKIINEKQKHFGTFESEAVESRVCAECDACVAAATAANQAKHGPRDVNDCACQSLVNETRASLPANCAVSEDGLTLTGDLHNEIETVGCLLRPYASSSSSGTLSMAPVSMPPSRSGSPADYHVEGEAASPAVDSCDPKSSRRSSFAVEAADSCEVNNSPPIVPAGSGGTGAGRPPPAFVSRIPVLSSAARQRRYARTSATVGNGAAASNDLPHTVSKNATAHEAHGGLLPAAKHASYLTPKSQAPVGHRQETAKISVVLSRNKHQGNTLHASSPAQATPPAAASRISSSSAGVLSSGRKPLLSSRLLSSRLFSPATAVPVISTPPLVSPHATSVMGSTINLNRSSTSGGNGAGRANPIPTQGRGLSGSELGGPTVNEAVGSALGTIRETLLALDSDGGSVASTAADVVHSVPASPRPLAVSGVSKRGLVATVGAGAITQMTLATIAPMTIRLSLGELSPAFQGTVVNVSSMTVMTSAPTSHMCAATAEALPAAATSALTAEDSLGGIYRRRRRARSSSATRRQRSARFVPSFDLSLVADDSILSPPQSPLLSVSPPRGRLSKGSTAAGFDSPSAGPLRSGASSRSLGPRLSGSRASTEKRHLRHVSSLPRSLRFHLPAVAPPRVTSSPGSSAAAAVLVSPQTLLCSAAETGLPATVAPGDSLFAANAHSEQVSAASDYPRSDPLVAAACETQSPVEHRFSAARLQCDACASLAAEVQLQKFLSTFCVDIGRHVIATQFT